MNPLIEQFKRYGKISLDAELDFHKKVIRQERNKNDFYLKEGQTSSGLFVMEKGLVRAFFIKNEKEINTWFGTENLILGSISPLFFNQPAKENIQFLEDSIVYSISRENLYDLYRKYHEIESIGRQMTEHYCLMMEERITSLQTLTAQERYEQLLQLFPELLQRVSLGHIASYLGITLETLSRIRGK